MTTKAPVVAWDSNVFISMIDGDADRLPSIAAILEDAEKGSVRLHCSALACVEVAYSSYEKTSGQLSPETEEKILDLWRPGSVVQVVEVHLFVIDRARLLLREAMTRGVGLKPPDAIHIATAMQVGADEFHTYDEGLFALSPLAGIPIQPPEPKQGRLTFLTP